MESFYPWFALARVLASLEPAGMELAPTGSLALGAILWLIIFKPF